MNLTDKPLAAAGLLSYRYKCRYGWIMIGARNTIGALSEASRSTDEPISVARLQYWDGSKYAEMEQT